MEEVRDERFFSWLHFYDVHTPYEPPEPFLSRYRGYPGARHDGEIAYLDGLMGELSPGWRRSGRRSSWRVSTSSAVDSAITDRGPRF
ncbi:MAG: hypothetical protein ACRD21_05600 [Vicinamibacteria bacterium]